VLWHVESKHEIFTPVISKGIAYAGSRNGTLYAFDATNGREQWRATFPGWVYSPALFSDTLITGGQNATLWALDPSNGKQRWSAKLPGELVFRPVVGTSATVLVTTFSADLVAYDTSSGTQQWRLHTSTANMTPTVSGNRVFMAGMDGTLRRISLGSGRLEWETRLAGRLSSPRLMGDDRVLVSNDDGKIFVLSAKAGVVLDDVRVDAEAVGAPFPHQGSVVQFFRNSKKLWIVANTEIPGDGTAGK
jgi:outer membrane protein assembly factor BamB